MKTWVLTPRERIDAQVWKLGGDPEAPLFGLQL